MVFRASVLIGVGHVHAATMDRDGDQRPDVEHQLQQREEDGRSECPVEQDHERTGEFGREHRTRREPAPVMVLRRHQQQNGNDAFHRKR